jgi:hypothetical protein
VVIHGLSGFKKKIMKNKPVATRSGEFNICGKFWLSGQKLILLEEASWRV